MAEIPLTRICSPDPSIRPHEPKGRRRSISMSLHETTTPSVKSLSTCEHHETGMTMTKTNNNNCLHLHHSDNIDLQSAYDKLTVWKRTIEKQLNRSYLNKLKEIDTLLDEGQHDINIIFGPMPIFDQLATVISRQRIADQIYDQIEFHNRSRTYFDLSSNNELLCTSDRYALIYEDNKSRLLVFDIDHCFHRSYWDVNEYGDPCDLMYSFYLDLFFIVTNRGLFTWSIETNNNPHCLQIDAIKPISGNRLWTVACTNTRSDVFVLFKLGSYVERWNSMAESTSWQRIQRWSNHDLFEQNDQRIRSIRMTDIHVAWTVESMKSSEWRIDLLNYHLQLIRQGIKIDHLNKTSSCLLSNFGHQQFMVIDSNHHLLFLVDSNGIIKQKTNNLTRKRIVNAAAILGNDEQWLVVRLEEPNQLHFIDLIKTKQANNNNVDDDDNKKK